MERAWCRCGLTRLKRTEVEAVVGDLRLTDSEIINPLLLSSGTLEIGTVVPDRFEIMR
jgi:hypothetical protein